MITEDRITTSVKETEAVGAFVASEAVPGVLIALHGELGSGKTTFMHGVAKHLGITGRVISPTFVIIRSYPVQSTEVPNLDRLYHMDLYRLASEKEIEEVGVLDLIKDPKNLVFIEWAEKMGSLLPKKRIDISFEYVDEKRRKIIIDSSKLKTQRSNSI